MITLRTLAPTAVDVAIVPGAAVRDPQRYARFWSDAQARVDQVVADAGPGRGGTDVPLRARVPAHQGSSDPVVPPVELPADPPVELALDPPVVTLSHAGADGAGIRYRSIAGDSLERPLDVLQVRLRREHLPDAVAVDELELLGAAESSVTVRLYDHGVAHVELRCDVGRQLDGSATGVEDRLEALQDAAIAVTEAIAYEVVRRYLTPVLAALRQLDEDTAVLEPPRRDIAPQHDAAVLWVARALFVDPDGPHVDAVVSHWLKDVGEVEGDRRSAAEILLAGDAEHVARWLNYVYLDADPDGARVRPGRDRHADRWQALRYAQCFYAALDLIDGRLSRILADSDAASARSEIADLRSELVSLTRRAEFILMQHQDVSKYVSRAVRGELDGLLEIWEHQRLVEQPVRFKIATCDRRLEDLADRRAERSALFTDLILLGIGVTSVLTTALTLAEFGRSVSQDPTRAAFDLSRSAVTQWFAAQPADAILFFSAVTSGVLVVLYLLVRRSYGR